MLCLQTVLPVFSVGRCFHMVESLGKLDKSRVTTLLMLILEIFLLF